MLPPHQGKPGLPLFISSSPSCHTGGGPGPLAPLALLLHSRITPSSLLGPGREQGRLWGNQTCLQVVKCGFESGPHFVLLLSSTPPFSSEEDSEGHSVQQASRQPPRVPSRMGPRPEDDWDWSDTETSEGSAALPGKGSGGPASSGEWSGITPVMLL